jgi:hypothetical protein
MLFTVYARKIDAAERGTRKAKMEAIGLPFSIAYNIFFFDQSRSQSRTIPAFSQLQEYW